MICIKWFSYHWWNLGEQFGTMKNSKLNLFYNLLVVTIFCFGIACISYCVRVNAKGLSITCEYLSVHCLNDFTSLFVFHRTTLSFYYDYSIFLAPSIYFSQNVFLHCTFCYYFIYFDFILIFSRQTKENTRLKTYALYRPLVRQWIRKSIEKQKCIRFATALSCFFFVITFYHTFIP